MTATLLMMPEGETPTAADFAAGDVFRSYQAAVREAHVRVAPHKPMVPWIELDGTIIDPTLVMSVNTPPPPLKTPAGSRKRAGRTLDEELEDTFPASDPPARIQP